jgi:outer membrane lipoprotein-sorting protein
MKPMKTFFASAVLVASVGMAASAQTAPPADVYKQMDDAAKKFRSFQANVTEERYTAVVQDKSSRSGTTAFQRVGGALQMVTHLEAGTDDPKIDILYKNGELDALQPDQKTETVIKAGTNRGEFDSLLTTGFGATSKDLEANWVVNFQGMETLDGVSCAKLDLVSKQQNVKNNFSHITIWLDPSRDISLKQVMYQPDGDTRTETYTNVQYNQTVPESLFKLNVPHGTQVTNR